MSSDDLVDESLKETKNLEGDDPMTEHRRFESVVVAHSEADEWSLARLEWTRMEHPVDDLGPNYRDEEVSCVCGQEDLRYLFRIDNAVNDEILYPVGSKCVGRINIELGSRARSMIYQHKKKLRDAKKAAERQKQDALAQLKQDLLTAQRRMAAERRRTLRSDLGLDAIAIAIADRRAELGQLQDIKGLYDAAQSGDVRADHPALTDRCLEWLVSVGGLQPTRYNDGDVSLDVEFLQDMRRVIGRRGTSSLSDKQRGKHAALCTQIARFLYGRRRLETSLATRMGEIELELGRLWAQQHAQAMVFTEAWDQFVHENPWVAGLSC